MTSVMRTGATPPVPTAARHESDAVLELSDLSELYRVRALHRDPVRIHDRSPAERAVRREVARSVLQHQLPALVAELMAAATDDLAVEPLTEGEAMASSELRVIEAVERCKSVLDGVALEALARLEVTIEATEDARFAALGRPRPSGWVGAAELTVLEVSTATGLGPQEVGARLDLATTRSPGAVELRSRLSRGEVSLYRACAIEHEIRQLPSEAGPGIVESTLRAKDDAPPSPTLFRQRLTRTCLAADREAAARRRVARRRRGAHARIDGDGLGVLTVTNDADKVIAAMERADAVARAARQAGDPRSLDQLRADVITDTLVFGCVDLSPRPSEPADAAGAAGIAGGVGAPRAVLLGHTKAGRRPAAHVTIVVPVSTALGLDDAPCEIPGYGWVTAEHARQIMLGPDSTWRRLLVDAETGAALRLETSAYRPTAVMRAHVEAVDGTCRGPGCTVPAARCDLDHDIPWPHGPTTTTNLTGKHRLHHNVRTHGHWRAERDPDDHTVRWRTVAGRRYTSRPCDWLEVLRDSPPHDRSSDDSGERSRDPQEIDDPPPF
ncbi:HNH endonuclease signature motif containing protein [Terrabacter sp. 2RAF25]|uniref:HNH endonuclease signature motif containing protein n=1 Tax=Terrabacter sp. 2RAF25 TaxID=3232998 RepID=UPI003F980B0F